MSLSDNPINVRLTISAEELAKHYAIICENLKNETAQLVETLEPLIPQIPNIELILVDIDKVIITANNILSVVTVSDNIASVNDLAGIKDELVALHADLSVLNAVADKLVEIDQVAGKLLEVEVVANNLVDISAVANSISDILDVKNSLTAIGALADKLIEVEGVYAELSNILSVQQALPEIVQVQQSLSEIIISANNIAAIQAAPQAAIDAIAARNAAEGFKNTTENLRNQTSDLRNETATDRNATQNLRNETETLRNETEFFALNAKQNLVSTVRNVSGATMPIGTPVRVVGATGENPNVVVANATSNGVPDRFNGDKNIIFGITTQSINNNAVGEILFKGTLKGYDTTAFNVGDFLFVAATGTALVTTPPASPAYQICVGLVTKSAIDGEVCINVVEPIHLNDITGVNLNRASLADKQAMIYNGTEFVNSEIKTINGESVVGSGDIVVGGGLEGSQYVFVTANGTDTENAQQLQDAYDLAKTKVKITETAGNDLIDTLFFGSPQSIQTGQNFFSYWSFLPEPIALGVQNVEIVSNEFSGIIQIDVNYSDNFQLGFTYNGSPLTNVTVFKPFIQTVQRVTVIVSPMYYNFDSDFVMDEEYIDLVSLDGNRSIIFNGTGTISITANDVFVKGVDVLDKNFTIADDLNLLKIENCKGGNNSFGGDPTFGNIPITVSGTFTDCVGGDFSFGGFGTASGTFTNCIGGGFSFSGSFLASVITTASGVFNNCIAGVASFGSGTGTASGTFTNCVGGNESFGKLASGVFINCTSGGGRGFGINVNGTASGTFTNCIGGDFSFGGIFSSTANNIASGVFTNCTGGHDSFGGGGGGELTGKLYYCRLTSGTFETVSGGGITRLCIDGNNNQNNQG